jgi:hypothetical protein
VLAIPALTITDGERTKLNPSIPVDSGTDADSGKYGLVTGVNPRKPIDPQSARLIERGCGIDA